MRVRRFQLLSIVIAGLAPQSVRAQAFVPPAQPSATAPDPGAVIPPAGSFANPFNNPYMNPYLNPYMTTQPMTRNDMLLFYMAGQQARGTGPGSAAAAGTRMPPALPQQAGRTPPPRPRPNSRVTSRTRADTGAAVPGRFNDRSHYFNDGRGNLAARYPAFGAVMTDAQGAPMAPGLCPAPNEGVGRYFNRNPAYNRNNGR